MVHICPSPFRGGCSGEAPLAITYRRVRFLRLAAVDREFLCRPLMWVHARGSWTHDRPDAVV